MLRLFVFFIFIGMGYSTINGQGLSDALRLSTTLPGGTARTIGAGGAFGALGGDFGSLSINPAGLGVYRSSEFVISPGLLSTSVSSIMEGNNFSTDRSRSYMGLENLGIVLHHKPASGLYASNLAIGLNKVANFNRDFAFGGQTIGSITDRFLELANGRTLDELDDFEAWPAYVVGAIYDFEGDLNYESDFLLAPNQAVPKSQVSQQTGSINELSITYAGNLDNKFNFGVGLGIPFVRFREIKTYREADPEGNIPFFQELAFTENLTTSGTGFNLKAGFLYTPVRAFRIGLALHTPTWYILTDDFITNMSYSFTDNTGSYNFTETSPDGNFRYRFNAPWKAIISLGSLYEVGDVKGFFSADLEFRDYRSARFNLGAYSNSIGDILFSQELNQEIDATLNSSTIIRVGTELVYEKLRLRGGVQMIQSPFAADSKTFNRNYTLGLGFREEKFFIDAAMIYSKFDEGYFPYFTSDQTRSPFIINEMNNRNLVVTIGFKF